MKSATEVPAGSVGGAVPAGACPCCYAEVQPEPWPVGGTRPGALLHARKPAAAAEVAIESTCVPSPRTEAAQELGGCSWAGPAAARADEWACRAAAVELVIPVLKGGYLASARPYCARHARERDRMNAVALVGGDPSVADQAERVLGSEDPAAFDDPEAAARSLAVFVPQEGDDVRVAVGHFRRPIRRALANSLRALFAGFECEWSRFESTLGDRAEVAGSPEALLAEVKGMVDAQMVKVVETIGEVL